MTEVLPETPQTVNTDSNQGCLRAALAAFVSIGIIGASFVAITAGWLLEQSLFEGSLPTGDFRWAIQLGYAAVILIPLAIVVAVKKEKRSPYLSLLLAAVLVLLMAPARFLPVTGAQAVALVQILALGLFALVLWRILPSATVRESRNLGLAAALGGVALIPWAAWGAFGSPIDFFLNLLTAVMLSVVASQILRAGIFDHISGQMHGSSVWYCVLTLLILAAGLGQNGNQWLMVLVLPLAGLAACALLHANSGNGKAAALWLALATAGPLVFFDPDELMMVTNSGVGETISVATRAGVFTLIFTLLAGSVLLALVSRPTEKRLVSPSLGWMLAGAVWFVAALVYVFSGQPGFYGEQVFVILKDQVDVSAAVDIEDIDQRRTYVYETMTQQAEVTQMGIRQQLDNFGIDYQPYYLVNSLEVNADALVGFWLGRRAEVDRILPSPHLRPLPGPLSVSHGTAPAPVGPDWNITRIGADRVWSDLGVRGEGVVVGQSDSGVQGDHPELADAYLGQQDHNYAWFDPWNHSSSPQDFGGHGTHTLGSALGNQVGIAPDASWIGCVNLARNLGNPAFYLDCMQFMLAPFPQDGNPLTDGDPSRSADVLNNSWGCPEVEGCDPETYLPAMRALRAAGIFVVGSAGNSGYGGCGSVDAPPAIYDEVYSVGAINSSGNRADFSSLGPVTVDGSQRVKPDILAPGEGVLSSYPGNSFEIASGTSMAGPQVVGVVALMWSANPELIGDIETTETILNETATPYQGVNQACGENSTQLPNNVSGFGVVNALAAVQRAINVK